MLKDSNGKVKIQGQLIEAFGIGRGLRQGDTQSTTLVNIVLEKLIRSIETNQNGKLFKETRHYIAYADDVSVIGRWVRAIEEVVTQIKEVASKHWTGDKRKQNKIHENKQNYNKFRTIYDNK
jgi:hypothetical protein